MAKKIDSSKLIRELSAAGIENVWFDADGGRSDENATPEQLAQAQALFEAHDPEETPAEKRQQERRAAPEFSTDNLTALVLELAAWAAQSNWRPSELATVILAKEAEIKQRHPDKPKGNTR